MIYKQIQTLIEIAKNTTTVRGVGFGSIQEYNAHADINYPYVNFDVVSSNVTNYSKKYIIRIYVMDNNTQYVSYNKCELILDNILKNIYIDDREYEINYAVDEYNDMVSIVWADFEVEDVILTKCSSMSPINPYTKPAEFYSKDEIDVLLTLKQDILNVLTESGLILSGNTISVNTDIIANKTYVDTQISGVTPTSLGLATVATTGDYDDLIDKPSLNFLPLSGGTMSNQTKVTDLNADMLDGKHIGTTSDTIPVLDINGKIPMSMINDGLLGNVQFQMVWDALTNTPEIPVATDENKGHYWICSVPGEYTYKNIISGEFITIFFEVGDWILSCGAGGYAKVDNTDAVSSVNGHTGAVNLTKSDVGLSNVDNTSDINKPISDATQTALNNKVSWNGNTNGAKKTIGSIDNYDIGIITNNTERITVSNDGNVGLNNSNPTAQLSQKSTSATESAPLGAELTSSTNWTLTSGWSGDYTNGFTHTSGAGTTTLSRTMTISTGYLYQISWTVTNRTAGSFTVSLGGQTSVDVFTSTGSFGPKTLNNTGPLIFTPTSDFNGTISLVSVKENTGPYGATYDIQDNTGVSTIEIRSSLNSLSNTFIGKNAGSRNTTGYYNSFIGYSTGRNNTTGYNNSFIGYAAGAGNLTGYNNCFIGYAAGLNNTTGYYNSFIGYAAGLNNTTGYNNSIIGTYAGLYNTTGYYNSFIGVSAGQGNTSGSYNTFIGLSAGQGNTTGYYNSFIGVSAGQGNTTGSYNTAIGRNAGRYLADGTTGRLTGNNDLYLGADTKASADGTDNENVLGYGAIGAGSNSVVLGNDSITKTLLKGNVGIGTTSPAANLHITTPSESTQFFRIERGSATNGYFYIGNLTSNVGVMAPIFAGKSNQAGFSGLMFLGDTNADFGTVAVTQFVSRYNNNVVSNRPLFSFANYTNNDTKLIILANGNVGIGTTSPTAQLSQKSTLALESAPLGTELTSSANWTLTSGWSGDYTNGFTHTAGAGITTLSRAMAINTGSLYQISWTVTNRTTGSFTVSLGGQISTDAFTSTGSFGPKTLNNTGPLIFTPTSDFNGTISLVSVKENTGAYGATYNILDNTGVSTIEIRSSLNSLSNTFIGKNAGSRNTTGFYNSFIGGNAGQNNTIGSYNSFIGSYAGQNNTTGSYNSFLGYAAGQNNTTGTNNSFIGVNAGQNNTTGSFNTAIGRSAGQNNTTGIYNSFIGMFAGLSNTTGNYNSFFGSYAGYHNTTGSYNSFIGLNAGRYIADGVTGRLTGNNGLYLGYNTKASADGTDNENVLGYGAIGAGSNSFVLGNSDITKTLLNGNVGIGTTSPTAKLDINSDVLRVREKKTPAASTSPGNVGDICWDDEYIYICIATNTWKRTALETW